ncbi:conserved protein of unknown function [Vibrio tapetis subsp. tapetis]|uniref:RES domain-containing protein n=2 Tax=Vibrio tapetis TaxID=52443 RepID=A0A2N8ZLC0_9VIBR|nr:conserved protein of unknown function [Vibrio tapetis subsp. tapetis]
MGMSDRTLQGYRLINTKYPPIALFDDVASSEDFEVLYALQALTNPRLKDEVGDLALIDSKEIPYNCTRNRSYAVAPFTHINPKGGRFNDGFFGALYIASNEETAAMEVKHHQQRYWMNVEGLEYDRFLFRGLKVTSSPDSLHVVTHDDNDILDPNIYSASQQLARDVKKRGIQGVQYPSVRSDKGTCWALFTPKPVLDIVQCYLLEMIWDGSSVSEVNKVSKVNL